MRSATESRQATVILRGFWVLLGVLLCGPVLGPVAQAGLIYVQSLSEIDAAVGFSRPYCVAVDCGGNVYIGDGDPVVYLGAIHKFTRSDRTFAHDWSYGSAANPYGLAVDREGNVYVCSVHNEHMQKFSQSGGAVSEVWSYAGNFAGPRGIAVDSEGSIYLADTGNDRIQKFSQSGGTVSHVWSYGTWGSADGEFNDPRGIAVDSEGSIYVVDSGNGRIQKFSQSGGTVSHVWSYGSVGSADGEFHSPYGISVDSDGSIYVADRSNGRIQKLSQSGVTVSHVWSSGRAATGVATDSRGNVFTEDEWWFDADELPSGDTAYFEKLTVHTDASLGNSLTLSSGRTLDVASDFRVEQGAMLTLSGGTLVADTAKLEGGSIMNVNGTVNCRIMGAPDSQINATGEAMIGDANRYDGFVHGGLLSVHANTVTVLSKGFASLGTVTEIDGGTLAAPKGVLIGPGRSLSGYGTVHGKVSAGFGSTIAATGPLTLGDADAYDGFFSDGSLLTGANTVTVNDRNEAVLGSLTELGDGAGGGTLTAGVAEPTDTWAHFLLEQGKNMIGRGQVNGNYKNHGHVIGDGTALDERIVFNDPWIVTGKGSFENTLIEGTFAPGESPCITPGTNQGFSGTVQIDLGGTQPGFGDNNHDQITDTATIWLFGSPTLEILPWNNFVPDIGDEFVIMTWQEGLDGFFADVVTDPWFTDHSISFRPHYNNAGGPGNLTLEAVPEPATLALLAAGLAALVVRKRRT